MYLATDQAEIYHKLIHLVLHSINATAVVAVAYKYFKNDHLKPQLICFLLLANEEARELNQMMFNDSLLAFYVIMCLYLVSYNKPLLATLMLTSGLSIKAGAILLIPGFFGWVQYQHGTIKLVTAIFIFIGF
jgi:Gpi18-like mannosyltransferase